MALTVKRIRTQNLTNKKYLSARKTRNIALVPAALNLGFAMSEAASHNLPTMGFLALQGFAFLKVAERAINTMLEYRAEYYKIFKRHLNIEVARYKNMAAQIAEDNSKDLTK